MIHTVGELPVSQIERLNWDLMIWRPARIAQMRATVGLDLTINGELAALTAYVYDPAPAGTVEEECRRLLGRMCATELQ